MGAKMYGFYAAEVQFHHDRAQRERDQRLRLLRAARLIPEAPLRTPAAPPVTSWPRPIALRAAGRSPGALAAAARA